MRSLRVACLGVAFLLASCAIGPDYKRPEDLPSAPDFRGEQTTTEQAFVDELPWWQIFGDPVLVDLTTEALEKNRDLAVAVARMEQSRYFVGVARSEFSPQIGYQGDAGRNRSPENAGGTGSTRDLFLGALNLAWEIDVWGRIRRSSEAAEADYQASAAFERGVRLSLISGVASAYFELRELDRELEISKSTAESYEKSRDLFQRQFEGGTGSRLAVERAEGSLRQTRAIIPDLEARIVAKENEISVLLGRPVGDIRRGISLTEQQQPPAIPAGLPATLLERRPDLIEAEQVLVAANARVGQAKAEFLPRIGLTSFIGTQSNELADVLDSGSLAWSAASTLTGPLFQGGRIWSLFQASKAARDAAAAQYDQQVLIALREVSDDLVSWQRLAEARDEQAQAVTAFEEAVRLARVRFWGGFASYFEILDAQQQLFPAEIALAQIELARLQALVRLYRALGGGWSLDELPPGATPTEESKAAPASASDETSGTTPDSTSGAAPDETSAPAPLEPPEEAGP